MPPFALILPAAGKSTRFGGPRSKLLETLAGLPVIARAVAPFLARADLSCLIIPCGDPEGLSAVLPGDDRIQFCTGGVSRAHSVLAALQSVPVDVEWVAVHDAARPLISPDLIEQTLQAARQYGAAVPALPVTLTIKQADGPLPARVAHTVPRHALWAMQTPQIMRRADLLDAFARCPSRLDQVTDDVQLLELAGHPVWLIPGQERNLKITTAVDLVLANWWLSQPAR
jgi:2-C-methyl-D-erythritol 4-phosphate cytidylyltransferase